MGTEKDQTGGYDMLTIRDLSFGYEKEVLVLDRFNLELKDGELIALMGPSGCGKSTLLQIIAKFLSPASGEIENTFEKISYAFQEPRLFPWLTVEENLSAVVSETSPNIQETLEMVEMQDTQHLYPEQLSGGMKSRVSLARAIMFAGDLFLLDEPFSALDAELRLELSKRLREWLKSSNRSAILVTHQEDDARLFADRIIYMR